MQSENYTEAGFTLKLYADKLSWVSEKCIDNKDETKEELYYKVFFLNIFLLISLTKINKFFSIIDYILLRQR